jgi:EGF-like domain
MRTFYLTAVLMGWVVGGLSVGCGSSESAAEGCDDITACSDHGICDDSSGEVECTCDDGYTGLYCSDCADGFVYDGPNQCGPSVPCLPETCNDHGFCDDSDGVAECTCETGYVGTACETCDTGYLDYGDGECRPLDPCTTLTTCADLNRECTEDEGQAVCGDCLEGYYEEGSVCIPTCAAETNPAQLVPLDLFFMIDRSASMTVDSKWGSVIAALQAFVGSADASGIGVGLQFFPLAPATSIPTTCSVDADCGIYGPCRMQQGNKVCTGSLAPDTSCEPTDYATPEVAIATLPGVQSDVDTALGATLPEGAATPSEPAMEGAVSYATTWAQANPEHLVYIVFATDGLPTGCVLANTIQGTSDLAQSAFAGAPPVPTFVIGVGTELTSLDQIAAAGGTGQAYIVDTGGNVTQQFIDALNAVRASGDCLYQIPEPENGTPNYGLINVSVTDPADPSSRYTVVNVLDEANCDPVDGGWYYDDPTSPAMILLCPATCDAVGQMEVEILVGCETIVN